MHCQEELEDDLKYSGFIPDDIIFKWYRDGYSVSRHLLTLYSIAGSIGSENILEIGFGRSSFVLAKAAFESSARFTTCDTRDFSYLLNGSERKVVNFVHGSSDSVWKRFEKTGIDFAFLDHFSDEDITRSFIQQEIETCLQYLKTDGVIAIHDTIVKKYKLRSVMSHWRLGFLKKQYELLSLPYCYGLGLIRKIGPSKYGIVKDRFSKKIEKPLF